jgi:EAL domain-containing protein (putative c-di-GMP-specific phosphodiesterase class I)
LAGETEAISVAARIEGLLATPFDLAAGKLFVTASVGIALSSGNDAPELLLRNANTAANRAKERGGNRYEIFGEALRQRTQSKLETGNDLRHAIERDELRVFYQPEIDLEKGTCVGVEALIRWEHPVRGLLLPAEFIPLAEENGHIVAIGSWVLRNACLQAATWRRTGTGPALVSVNLAARELAEPSLISQVSEALDQAGLDPAALCLEITETCLVEDPASAVAALASLRDLGVRLSIDDFGTGYSSLLYLRRYAADYLKIDRSFVAGLGVNDQDDAIITSVINLAHEFGLTVVAEGVETHAQAARLREMNCDIGQGYFWSPPVPATELPTTLHYVNNEPDGAARQTMSP